MASGIYYQITVGLRFRSEDAHALRLLAATDSTANGDSVFAKAADAAEKGSLLVVQCMTNDELQEIMTRFPLVGIPMPKIEPLRVGHGG